MNRVLLIKYGELSTKKGNRNFFINTLYHTVCDKLEKYNVEITKDRARMCIYFHDQDLEDICKAVGKIFGIHTYHIAIVCDSTEESIKDTLLKAISEEKFSTFKMDVRRCDKRFPIHSQDFNRVLGGVLLKNIPNIKVDVHNPDLWINVEIREEHTYIYYHTYEGCGGYPVGTQPKGMLMLSGGIDSPVAGYMAMKRGVEIEAVYFEAVPHTSLEAREKVITLCRKLSEYTNKIHLHVVNFTPIQESIYQYCRDDYCITIMRRMMYRLMDMIAKKYKGLVIINGESIGQVASQTLTSMSVINEVTNMPVIRPVACLDKLEIIDLARKIDTYETSILPYEDCCTVFVPKHPVINPSLETCIEEESKFDYLPMLEEAVNSLNTIVVTPEDSEYHDYL